MLDSIFSADSALMRVLGRLADVVVLNLLFVLTSLPVVTLGASLTALHATGMRIVRGETDELHVAYLRTFRSHLGAGSRLLLVLLGLAAVLGAWLAVVTAFVADPLVQLLLTAVWVVLALQVLATGLFAFPYLAAFDDPLRRVLRNALLMSWKHPLTTLVATALTVLPVVVTVYYPRTTGYGLLWLLVGFAALAVVTDLLFTRIFDRYAPRPAPLPEDGTARALS